MLPLELSPGRTGAEWHKVDHVGQVSPADGHQQHRVSEGVDLLAWRQTPQVREDQGAPCDRGEDLGSAVSVKSLERRRGAARAPLARRPGAALIPLGRRRSYPAQKANWEEPGRSGISSDVNDSTTCGAFRRRRVGEELAVCLSGGLFPQCSLLSARSAMMGSRVRSLRGWATARGGGTSA